MRIKLSICFFSSNGKYSALGIAYYRVIKPSQVLRKYFDIEVIGADFRHWGTTEEAYTRLGRDYDLIITKHIDNGQAASNMLATAQHHGRKVIVDLDDNYLEMRKDNPAYPDYAVLKGGRYFLGAMMTLANGLTVSTEPLKEAYTKLNQEIDVLPNCNDIKDWTAPIKKHDDGKIRIGYAGGSAHGDDLALIIEPMARILEKYPNVYFEICGSVTALQAKELGSKMLKFASHRILEQLRITGGTMAWQGYPELMASFGWDIGIAPLVDEPFNRGKSHIKWMEYSMIGAVTVASPVYPYKEPIQGVDVITDQMTGAFASNSEEWFNLIEFYIRNPDVRKATAKRAYKHIKDHWQYKQHADKWKQVIEKYL